MDKFASSPLRRSRRARCSFFGCIRVRRRCLWHHRHIAVRRRTSTSRTACVRRLVKSVGPFGPWCLRSDRVRCFLRPLYAAVLRGARHSVPPPLRGGVGASLSIRRSCYSNLARAPTRSFEFLQRTRIGARTSRRASCNRVFNPRARTVVRRNPSYDGRPSFRRPGCRRRGQEPGSLALPGGIAILAARAVKTTTPYFPDSSTDKHPVSRARDDERIEVPSILRPRYVAARGAFEFVPSRRRAFLRAHPAQPLFRAASPPGPSITRSAAKPCERLQSRVLSSKRSYR